ncbi:glycosyltransferase [Sphingobacterium deserti]|uniref:Glycosyl transferase group 1 n=1 Tax=Sphingobacterium deserti TaxID=1229276 RepID=A0A0B8T3W3_9SPHI|nr:glycosyltransferase [Sphingobacterium deserti]KGE13913.1 glycosyl transferase group 1 [Sphingobacterium deserti]
MKIVLVQHTDFINGTGGAEKMCCFLANGFQRMGYDVEIATNQNVQGVAMFALAEGVRVTNIYDEEIVQESFKPIFNYRGSNPLKWCRAKFRKKLAKYYNNKLKKKYAAYGGIYTFNLLQRSKRWSAYLRAVAPDVVISTSLSSALEITYQNKYDFPVVNSVNGRPDYDYDSPFGERDPIEKQLLIETFTNLTAIQVLFASYERFLPTQFKGMCFVIPNPVPKIGEGQLAKHDSEKTSFSIVNIARLDNACKQQEMAIRVFHRLADTHQLWNMFIWGIGRDKDYLEGVIDELKLTERVILKGFTEKPLEKLKRADIFLFPSKFEGFGLALAEAMAVGLPVVGLSNCSGVNELIKNNKNGFLVESEEQMIECLVKLMESPSLRKNMGSAGAIDMREYNERAVLSSWNELLHEVLAQKG